jgi:arsenical pump membrane protein
VSWDILAFLFLIFLTALGLENIGVTTRMREVYANASPSGADGIGLIGALSALGSAVLNNHPMAALNALALQSTEHDARQWRTLAALIGGDLGPRFLPIGSLAGLIWIEMARRLGVEIRTWQFVRTGFLVTVPTLAVSLAVLWLETFVF